jgi:hypothetical protein
VKYRFDRPANSVLDFGRTNRPSTDALGALHRWREAHRGREFSIAVDEDNHIDAELTCEVADVYAGAQLDVLCLEHGVRRQVIL